MLSSKEYWDLVASDDWEGLEARLSGEYEDVPELGVYLAGLKPRGLASLRASYMETEPAYGSKNWGTWVVGVYGVSRNLPRKTDLEEPAWGYGLQPDGTFLWPA